MPVNTIIKQTANPTVYPSIQISKSGQIVLFNSYGVGTILDPGEKTNNKIGHYSSNFDMEVFTPFGGTVTLSNY